MLSTAYFDLSLILCFKSYLMIEYDKIFFIKKALNKMGFLIDKKIESIITNLPYVMLCYNKLINYQLQPIKINHVSKLILT